MAKFDGQTIIDRAFDLNTGAAYALSSVGLVWARRPWRPWSALGGFGKAPADALRVRFRVYLNAAPGASVRLGRTFRPAPPFVAVFRPDPSGRFPCPDSCRAHAGRLCPHGLPPWRDILGAAPTWD